MPAVSLGQIVDLLTKQPSIELEGLALQFFDAFTDREPLQEQNLNQWMVGGKLVRHPREVLSAVHEAIAQKWVEDSPEGLRLTEKGLAKRKATKTAIANTPNEGAIDEIP